MERLAETHTVTFDCWGTLICETDSGANRQRRVELLVEHVASAGEALSLDRAAELLDDAWARHNRAWHSHESTGAPDIARWALAELGLDDARNVTELTRALEDVALGSDAAETLDGARETLASLRARGVRTALICDTGFSPGRVVREILARNDLLDLLEVLVFSNEVGVPKPSELMFTTALDALGVSASGAAHVGDLRRTDIHGARDAGMLSVRITQHYDDKSDRPEADIVAASHAELRAMFEAATKDSA